MRRLLVTPFHSSRNVQRTALAWRLRRRHHRLHSRQTRPVRQNGGLVLPAALELGAAMRAGALSELGTSAFLSRGDAASPPAVATAASPDNRCFGLVVSVPKSERKRWPTSRKDAFPAPPSLISRANSSGRKGAAPDSERDSSARQISVRLRSAWAGGSSCSQAAGVLVEARRAPS